VACEVLVTPRRVILAGEITSNAVVDYPSLVRGVLADIGYGAGEAFDGATVPVECLLNPQARDIAQGVDTGGAGDQGLMFGYACTDTPTLMPAPIAWAHALAQRLTAVRKTGVLPYLKPDGKTQVTVAYAAGRPARVDTVVVSCHHAVGIDQARIAADIRQQVIEPVLAPLGMLDDRTAILVNPTGAFTVGGPEADTGVTGRKIIVDTYGGMARHGGGAFSGKDPTKVDRSAAYLLRYIAKTLVAEGWATRLEVRLAYAIGKREPVDLAVDSFGTATIRERELIATIRDRFDLTPTGIIEALDLRRPQYRPLAAYGQLGREDAGVRWEQCAATTAAR
jgi:S-adenosylmethionine synthetase